MKKYFLITILFAVVTKGSALGSSKQENIPSLDEADLFNRINHLFYNILKFKEVIDIVSQDPLRILDLTYFILKNEVIFIQEAEQIKTFQDFDDWFAKILVLLLEYIKQWKTALISTVSTTSMIPSLASTATTSFSSTSAFTNSTINKTTRTTTTTTLISKTNAANTTINCVYTTASYPDLNTTKTTTTETATTVSNKTTIWITKTSFHTTTKFLSKNQSVVLIKY